MMGAAAEGRAARHARAAWQIAWGSLALVPFAPFAAWVANTAVLLATGAALCFALLGLWGARLGSDTGRIYVGIGLIGQAICITAALAGHPLQIDSHMLFFALLAMCLYLGEPIVIIVAAGMIAAHHLSLALLMPRLVYPTADLLVSLERTAMHGIIVVVEAAVIWSALRRQITAEETVAEAGARAAASAEEAQKALAETKAANAETEVALRDARRAKEAAEASRKAAEAETEKAREADRRARLLEQEERARKAKSEAELAEVVKTLGTALHQLSCGQLANQIAATFPEEYEDLRRDFNEAGKSLLSAMALVDTRAGTIIGDVFAIEQAADNLARRTESQASTLEETTAAISQIAEHSRTTSRSAQEASRSVGDAKQKAAHSEKVVQNAIGTMSKIEDSSGEISKIVRLIEDIAFQTNLLALNAGVEAARAGETGRGFSVVASEVRALALRSSEAAKEIASLISTSREQVTDGVRLVRETGSALDGIVAAVEDIAHHVALIETSAREQAHGITESSEAMQHLEGVTQQNAAMFEETNSFTQSLALQARQLSEAIGKFDIGAERRGEPVAGQRAASSRQPPVTATPPAVSGNRALAVAQPAAIVDAEGWEEF